MSRFILEVDAIEKRFGSVRAVDGLSFRVQPGEIFALLGPNGAGKTTVVRMLLRILHPDRGTIRYGMDGTPRETAHPHEIGYLPEDRGLYREVPVDRTLSYLGALRGMSRGEAASAAEAWLKRLQLLERKKEKLDQLSKGNQQKVQFVASILHRPTFAILDDPFSGLDPVNQELFLEIMRELRSEGMTILLSAHQMDLVQRLADRVLLMHRGRSVLEGTIAEVRASAAARRRVVLRIGGSAGPEGIRGLRGVERVEPTGPGEYACSLQEGISMSAFLAAASTELNILDVHSQDPSLHEIFLATIGDGRLQDAREEEPA